MHRLTHAWLVVSLTSFALLSGCAGQDGGNEPGSMALKLVLQGGFDPSVLSVQLTNDCRGVNVFTGVKNPPSVIDVDVSQSPGDGAIVGLAEITGLAPGRCTASAVASTTLEDGSPGYTVCEGSASYDVAPDHTTSVQLVVDCTTQEQFGSGDITLEANACPVLETTYAAATEANVGAKIALVATARDKDGDPIAYSWTSAPGTIEDGDQPKAEFTCLAEATYAVTISVDDGRCEDSFEFALDCGEGASPVCGDGVQNPGEQCDDGPNGSDTCTPDCTIITPGFCGDGTVDEGEECDDGPDGSDACTADCMTIVPPACGDGNVDEGEECDDGPNGSDTCTADCRIIVPSFCGDGTVDEGEECDDGPNGSDTCTADCVIIVPSFCGDGIVDEGEECDDGPNGSDTCTADCTIPEPPGACAGADATTILGLGQAGWLTAISECTIPGCLSGLSVKDPQCVATCLVNNFGIQNECGLCYGDSAVCGSEASCLACAFDGPTSDACLECTEAAGCTSGAEECSGISF